MAITNGPTPDFERKKKASETLAEQARRRRKLAQEDDQENQENQNNAAFKAERKRKEKALKARMSQKNMAIQAFTQGAQVQGVMEKFEHLAGLTAEGVAGESLFDLIIFATELTLNTPFWTQTLQFEEALRKELESLDSGEPVRLCYLPDDNGVFPEIYPADGQGKVNFNKPPLRPEEITNFAIRANGYVPRPTVTESLLVVFDRHLERVSGTGSLSPEQKARMYNTVMEMRDENDHSEKNDVASDTAARMMAMRQAAKPTPTRPR